MNYTQGFLQEAAATELLAWLCDAKNVAWQQETLQMFGRRVTVPRLTSWCGDPGVTYTYTGLEHHCTAWLEPLADLRDKLEAHLQTRFNMVIANRYLNGKHHMGWHQDNEPGCTPLVASISLGATRRFRTRDADTRTSQAVELEHGSLLVFDAFTAHRLCPTQKEIPQRVNLTFRLIEAAA